MALDCPALSFVCWQTTNRNVKCQQVQLGDQLLLGNVWKQLGWVFALGGLQHALIHDLLICDDVPPPTFFFKPFSFACFGSKWPSDMWRCALRLPNGLLLLVSFNPHRIFSEPDIIWFSQTKKPRTRPENNVLCKGNKGGAKEAKEEKEDTEKTFHFSSFWFSLSLLWSSLISNGPFWDSGISPAPPVKGLSNINF